MIKHIRLLLLSIPLLAIAQDGGQPANWIDWRYGKPGIRVITNAVSTTTHVLLNNRVKALEDGAEIDGPRITALEALMEDNASNWNTAYSWGDWRPIVRGLEDRTRLWNEAYLWGNHALAGYLKYADLSGFGWTDSTGVVWRVERTLKITDATNTDFIGVVGVKDAYAIDAYTDHVMWRFNVTRWGSPYTIYAAYIDYYKLGNNFSNRWHIVDHVEGFGTGGNGWSHPWNQPEGAGLPITFVGANEPTWDTSNFITLDWVIVTNMVTTVATTTFVADYVAQHGGGGGGIVDEKDPHAMRVYHYGNPDIEPSPTNWFTFALINNDKEWEITKYNWDSLPNPERKNVVIPYELNGKPVTSIGRYGFLDENIGKGFDIESLIAPRAIKNIGSMALAMCSELEYVVLPEVEVLGSSCFTDCELLTSITISSNAPVLVDGSVFGGNHGLIIYVDNPTATGYGATFGGRPVVRPNLHADGLFANKFIELPQIVSGTNLFLRLVSSNEHIYVEEVFK